MVLLLDCPAKGLSDPCEYRCMRLDNLLDALLIHDPQTDKASAALDVRTGSMMDPVEWPGLAHFLEHLLFMGTEKYRDESEYQTFLTEHAGSSNAYTDNQDTNYHFDVGWEYLEEALDRFAQFFIAPLFDPSCTEREREAVHSEHQKNISDDYWRMDQVLKSLAAASHPYNHFGTGTRDTLSGPDVRASLLSFYQKHYSSDRMKLVVYGREPLDTLQRWIVDRFSAIPLRKQQRAGDPDKDEADAACKRPRDSWAERPFGPAQTARIVWIRSLKALRLLEIHWWLDDLQEHYRAKPLEYISHLLAHEEPGSLLASLKARGWATSLSAGPSEHVSGSFTSFKVGIRLSRAGLLSYQDVLLAVFGYLRFLREKGPQEQIYRECSRLSSLHFEYDDRKDPSDVTQDLARSLHLYDPKNVLSGPVLMETYCPGLVAATLEKELVPSKALVFIAMNPAKEERTEDESLETETEDESDAEDLVSSGALADTGLCLSFPNTERYYGTQYHLEPLDTEVLEQAPVWPPEQWFLPPPNPYLPQDLSVKENAGDGKTVVAVQLCPGLFFKQDDTFGLPKGLVWLAIERASGWAGPGQAVAHQLWLDLLEDWLDERLYSAALAGISFEVSGRGGGGLVLSIAGFSDRLGGVLAELLRGLWFFEPSRHRIAVFSERLSRRLKDLSLDPPYKQSAGLLSLLLQSSSPDSGIFGAGQLERALQQQPAEKDPRSLTGQALYLEKTLSLECLVHGNWVSGDAQELQRVISKSIPDGTVSFSEPVRPGIVELEQGKSVLFSRSIDNPNNGLHVYIQLGPCLDDDDTACGLLVAQALCEPFFDQLRTKDQLGYVVRCQARQDANILGLEFLVQSGVASVGALWKRVSRFISEDEGRLFEDSAAFGRHVASLRGRLQERPTRLKREAQAYWSALWRGDRIMDLLTVKIAKRLGGLSRDTFLAYYKKFVVDPGMRRLLTVALTGGISEGAAVSDLDIPADVAIAGDGVAGEDAALDWGRACRSWPRGPAPLANSALSK